MLPKRMLSLRRHHYDLLIAVLWVMLGGVWVAIAIVAFRIERDAPLLFLVLIPAFWMWPRARSNREYALMLLSALTAVMLIVGSSLGHVPTSGVFWVAMACALAVGLSFPFLVKRASQASDVASSRAQSALFDEKNAFLRSLFAAQEEERRRIASELHDRLGQLLTALRYHVENVEAAWKTDAPAAEESIASAKEILDTAYDDLHRIVANLRPHVLEDFGLVAAIHWYVRNYLEKTGLIVHLNVEPIGRLDRDLESCLFHVLQEASTNIIRHAHASEIDIVLGMSDEESIYLEIGDDGRGFAYEKPPAQGLSGFGLRSMVERVQSFGGTCEIDSRPGDGCRVCVAIPAVRP